MSSQTHLQPDRSRFPDTMDFTGISRPGRVECDVLSLELEGTLPPELDGAFYRCGPDRQFPPLCEDDLYINGDGMVTKFDLHDGRVDLRTRYVRTDRLEAERAAGRALFGVYRNPFTDDPSVAGVDRTTANTSVIWHGDRLFAVKEDGLPHDLDPITLATLGKWDGGGRLRSRTFTAHPKIDPVSGDMLFYGYSALGDERSDDIAVGAIGADGTLKQEVWFKPPYQSVIHDWGVTQTHLVFVVMPLTTDEQRLRDGGPRWAWDPGLPTYVCVMPRVDPGRTMVFEGPPCWSFHTMNAHDDGHLLHLDLNVAPFAPFPDIHGEHPDYTQYAEHLTRWTFDLSKGGGTFESRLLVGGMATDFTEPDPRHLTRPYRYGYFAGVDPAHAPHPSLAMGMYFNTVGRYDHETDDVDTYFVGDDASVQEPMFVPRHDDAAEGEGYVLTVVNRAPELLGEMLVFDAQRIADGPITRALMPVAHRPVFHSTWIPRRDLPGGVA